MTPEHPITPPPELVEQWEAETAHTTKDETWHVAVQAARWGADQELEACAKEVSHWSSRSLADRLRTARRPKPQSLKEQALEALGHLDKGAEWQMDTTEAVDTIRRALEQLDD